MEWIIGFVVFVVAANTAILFRSILIEVRYRRAVRRRIKHYASLNEAIKDHRLR